MSIPTSSELALIRTQPHQLKMWLSVYRPTTVLACLVNDAAIARGARVITYDTVSSGSFANIRADYTMLVGTSAGASDVGRIRVRSADATTITVAENSDVAWADNLFLTVLKYVDLVPIFPRIIQDPANATNVIFYKDYDLAYTNQNSVLGTILCATNHKAGFRDPNTGIYQAYWTASGSYSLTGETGTYSWEFEGGTPSTYVGLEPGYVQYSTPGFYQASLTVTGANINDVTYRYVSVYDRPEAGNSHPDILKWELEDISGSRDEGGYSIKIKAWDAAGFISANDLVVLFADEWFGNTQQNIGGNAKNNSSIKFVGYVVDGSITYNWREGFVEFEIESPTGIMARKEGFSVSCESKVTPATWFEIKDLSVPRAIYHYLRWHSTVLKVCDFQYTGPDYKVQYFDADRESLKDAIGKFIEMGLRGELVCDKQGKIWAEVSAGATPSSETTFPIALTMNKNDWMGEPQIDERLQKDISYLEYGGIAYSGITTGTFSALMAGAPGSAPSYAGKPDRQQGLILASQTQLNALTGNMFAYKNSRYPDIEFVMGGNYANLDIAPIERIQVNLAATDTPRGITLTNAPFHITRIAHQYDANNGTYIPTINVAQLVNGVAAETIPIPPQPPDNGYKVPKISIPAIPALTFPSFDFSGLGIGLTEFISVYNSSKTVSGLDVVWDGVLRLRGTSFQFPSALGSQAVTILNDGIYLFLMNARWVGDTANHYFTAMIGTDLGSYGAYGVSKNSQTHAYYSQAGWVTAGTNIYLHLETATNFTQAAMQILKLMS